MADGLALSDLAGHGADRPAAERGGLDVADRVVAALARRASADVEGTVRHGGSVAGLMGRRYPDASVSVLGQRAWIELDVAGTWPCDVSDLGARTRETVARRVGELGGVHVERLDVTVHVVSETEAEPRRVQ